MGDTKAQQNALLGTWGNMRRVVTANYTLSLLDKGWTLCCSGASITVTVPAASGFDADFQFVILNEDGVRAMAIAINGFSTFRIYPGQSILVYNQNSNWRTIGLPSRYKLSASLNYYVDVVNGSDSNDGLSPGAGNALQHIQTGINRAAQDLDLGSNTGIGLNIICAAGTYQESLTTLPYIGRGQQGHSGPINIQGTSVASQVVIAPPSGNAVTAVESGGFEYDFTTLTITSPTGNGIAVDQNAWININNCIFGSAAGNHVVAQGGIFEVTGGYTIAAPASNHMNANNCGKIFMANGAVTITTTSAMTFPGFFMFAQDLAFVSAPNSLVTFVNGSVISATRYSANSNAVIDTQGGGANFFPGNVAGTTATGGQYL